jgi:hypothetical protein
MEPEEVKTDAEVSQEEAVVESAPVQEGEEKSAE